MERSGIISASGYFTMLKYVAQRGAADLERILGFEKGRLENGFLLAVLCEDETMSYDEFVLRGSSRWSGGIVRKVAGKGYGIEDILTVGGQDIDALKAKIATFFARRGENTPAKVMPNLRHTEGMIYPDAEALGPGIRSGVPQFEIPFPAVKRFKIVEGLKG